jgi:sensor histidine kinase YesM
LEGKGYFCEKQYKIVFFQDKKTLQAKLVKTKYNLKEKVIVQFAYFILIFMIGFCAIMWYILVRMTNAITRPVIELYELIKHIVD